ncbi:hypothetical protein FB567DRAFT_580123 [Paraphoma chrysanthemicola]|uniref:Uncharacterized protein n=1 Tax=Paraphoma chrysanthemicola TaxID=798071 RepID=A0A8K0R6U3_9PLEO|nr:hypothetical protein FB567DRAFT_580123 [Paraphoma chrysanthemicola]
MTLPQSTTILLHTLNILIGIISIAILSLVARSVALTDKLSSRIPSDVRGTDRGMLFWPGCGGVVDMLLFGFLWMKLPAQNTKKRRVFLNALVFVACFILGRPLIVLVYTFVEDGRARKTVVESSTKAYTIESWSCAYASTNELRVAGALCMELRGARFLLIPSVVFGAVMLLLVIWLRRKMGREGDGVLAREDGEEAKSGV